MHDLVTSIKKRLENLRSERSSFIPVYQELSDYHLGHRGRFLTTKRNKGHKRNTLQYNNTSRLSVRTLASGMMAGITSPARPWFRLEAPDPDLMEIGSVKEWLHDVQNTMYKIFAQSNVYNSLHMLYAELGTFGTGSVGIFENFDNVVFARSFTVGEYFIASNEFDEIDSFYREYDRTVGQLVKQFGYDKCSNDVKDSWDKGNTERWVTIIHAIEPNDNRDRLNPHAKFKKFRSVYFERSEKKVDFLRESGFDDFPILTPRWDIAGGDIYATDCPGMTALGDTKTLQLGEKRKYQIIDKIANPPLRGDSALRSKIPNGILQGGETIWTDGPNQTIESIYGNYRPDLNSMMAVNNEAEMRIKRAFYEDLFLMISQSDRRQITAREIAEKQEEKLLMIGPVLERLHKELLDPLITRTFNIADSAGIFPEAPQELGDTELKIEYVSILAQAQRMISIGGLEQTAAFVGNLAPIWPEARHKFDSKQAIDDYAEAIGLNPKVIRSDDEVEEMEAADAQAAAQQQAMEQGAAMADTAAKMGQVDTGGDNIVAKTLQNAGLA